MSTYHARVAERRGIDMTFSVNFGTWPSNVTRTIRPSNDITIAEAIKWFEKNEIEYVCTNWKDFSVHEDSAIMFRLSVDQTGFKVV